MFIELSGILFNAREIQFLHPDSMAESSKTAVFCSVDEHYINEPYEQVGDTILSMERQVRREQLAATVLAKQDSLHTLSEKQRADAVRNALAIADLLMKGSA